MAEMMDTAAESARRIVHALIKDLCDRRGLRQAWEQIDDDVQREIVKTWTQIATKCLTEQP
jgi:hypothetical protein